MVKREIFSSWHMIRFSTAILLLLGIAEVVGTLMPVQAQDSRSEDAIALPQAYWDAVEDARNPQPQKVFKDLTAITPDNNALTWDKSGRVLVTTWTNWDGYSQNVNNQLILTRDLWVTVVPDLQAFCKKYTPTAKVPLATRLNQLLGLPPESAARLTNRQVVEIWVEPQFLFRPSPDPEITDHEAELSFRPPSEFISVLPGYQRWFYAQYDQRYQHNGQPMTPKSMKASGALPYPWTQLGYTYDWGNASDWKMIDPSRPPKVGLSEFVIRQWSPISVKATQGADSYCR